jgi:hypothetical protein
MNTLLGNLKPRSRELFRTTKASSYSMLTFLDKGFCAVSQKIIDGVVLLYHIASANIIWPMAGPKA